MSTHSIVFDIGGMRFRSGVVDNQGNLTNQVAFESPTHPREIVDHITRIVESNALSLCDPVVGIAIGGMVEKNGCVTAGSMNMFDYSLVEQLQLRYPAVAINDAKAAALAEAKYNPRLKGESSFVSMTVSAGIGGGVIINGDLYEGNTGIAGEVGHMIIDRGHNAYCRLGHRGCLDALASGRALDNRLKRLWREGHWTHLEHEVDLRDLPALLAAGDGMAKRLVDETGKWIGAGVMNIIRVVDPCEIVFKGYLMTELWQYIHPSIAGVLESYERGIPLSLSSLGENVGLIGAGLAAQKLRESLVGVG
jgi:glucokinase